MAFLQEKKLVDRFVLGILFIANRELLALELDVRSTAQALSTREKIKKLAIELLVLKTKMTCPRKKLSQNKTNKTKQKTAPDANTSEDRCTCSGVYLRCWTCLPARQVATSVGDQGLCCVPCRMRTVCGKLFVYQVRKQSSSQTHRTSDHHSFSTSPTFLTSAC